MSEPAVEATVSSTPGSTEQAGVPSEIERLAFDQALAELQAVVAKLEAALHAHCARLLTAAELRVQRLVEGTGGRLSVLDLRPDDES
jgi:exonuclease VII small subunit